MQDKAVMIRNRLWGRLFYRDTCTRCRCALCARWKAPSSGRGFL